MNIVRCSVYSQPARVTPESGCTPPLRMCLNISDKQPRTAVTTGPDREGRKATARTTWDGPSCVWGHARPLAEQLLVLACALSGGGPPEHRRHSTHA